MIDGTTINYAGISGSIMCSILEYSVNSHNIPDVTQNNIMDKTAHYKTTLFTENKITISTEEKTKTEKGGN